MQSLIRSKSAGVTGGRGTAGAGPGRDLLYVVESLIAIGSRWVHGSFPARPLANVVDVTVAGPQPAGVRRSAFPLL